MARLMEHDHTILSPSEATQGEKSGHVRYVLGFSLALAVAAGVMMLMAFVG
jgi:hypothetical protein